MSRQKSTSKAAYHHGDLRRQLLDESIAMVTQDGLDALSLRKLAERVGVSQTAIYHHFSDKQALSCAMAEEGITLFSGLLQEVLTGEATLEQRFERFVSIYVRFALANPELYELLFGRTTWKGEGEASAAFRAKARASFRSYAVVVMGLQADGFFSSDLNPLRLAQVMWGTLHGLCRMYNDGLAFTPADVEEISQYARGLLQRMHRS